jgi:(p)ppGpp synthase/HD superfamily hydrolase
MVKMKYRKGFKESKARREEQTKKTDCLIAFLEAEDRGKKFEALSAYLEYEKSRYRHTLHERREAHYTITAYVGGWMETVDSPLHLTETVEQALMFARNKHEGRLREDGEPFFRHVLDVLGIIIDTNQGWESHLLPASLIGILDDGLATYEELCDKFGEEAAKTAQALTRMPGESADEYAWRLFRKKTEKFEDCKREEYIIDASIISLADRLARLRVLPCYSDLEVAQSYFEETTRLYYSIAGSRRLLNGIYSEVHRLEEQLWTV